MDKSGIYIKPENRGKFTAEANAAGESVQGHAASVLANPNASPLDKKRANFARNAAKWHHEDGIKEITMKPMKYDGGSKKLLKKAKASSAATNTSRTLDVNESELSDSDNKLQAKVSKNSYDSDDKGVYRKRLIGKKHVGSDEAVLALRTGKVKSPKAKMDEASASTPAPGISAAQKINTDPEISGLIKQEPKIGIKQDAETPAKPSTSITQEKKLGSGKYIKFTEMNDDQKKQYRAGISSGKDFEVAGIGKYKGVPKSPSTPAPAKDTHNFTAGGAKGNYGTEVTPKIGIKVEAKGAPQSKVMESKKVAVTTEKAEPAAKQGFGMPPKTVVDKSKPSPGIPSDEERKAKSKALYAGKPLFKKGTKSLKMMKKG